MYNSVLFQRKKKTKISCKFVTYFMITNLTQEYFSVILFITEQTPNYQVNIKLKSFKRTKAVYVHANHTRRTV